MLANDIEAAQLKIKNKKYMILHALYLNVRNMPYLLMPGVPVNYRLIQKVPSPDDGKCPCFQSN